MEYDEEYEEEYEDPRECEDPEEWVGGIIDSIDSISDLCFCKFEEIKRDAHTTEWVLKCDKYTLTITLSLKTPS